MGWEVLYTDEFEAWWLTLSEEQQEQIDAAVEILEERGPTLGRPLVETLSGSRLNNLKELRVSKHGALRILFIFNPLRQAILLCGGDKTGNWKDWYREAIEDAERLYEVHFERTQGRGAIAMKKFSELRKQVRADPQRAARVQAHKASLLAELSLAELRRAREVTQEDLAATLNTTQSAVSRLEHQADLYLSTLRKYVEAVGGKLQIMAEFPDATIPINAFATLGEDAVRSAWSRLQLVVQHGPLPAFGERQRSLPLAAASEATDQPYYIFENLDDAEILATISRRLRSDELLLEWVRLPEPLEGSRVHIRVETSQDQLLEADVYPVSTGLETVVAKGQRLAPTAVSRVTLEFSHEPEPEGERHGRS